MNAIRADMHVKPTRLDDLADVVDIIIIVRTAGVEEQSPEARRRGPAWGRQMAILPDIPPVSEVIVKPDKYISVNSIGQFETTDHDIMIHSIERSR